MSFSIYSYVSEDYLIKFCKTYHIKKLSVFGSAIKNSLGSDSDIDLLVEFEPDHIPGLLTIARMEYELSNELQRRIDIRTPEDLSQYFRDDVLKIAEVQYAQ